MAIGQQLGLAILFTLMAFAFFNDLNRLFGG
jgi:regulator of sigma E protease